MTAREAINELQKRMNVRIDYGIGLDSSAFYISFNEAF